MVDELVRTYSDWVMLIIRLYHGTQVIWNQKLKKKKILDFVENALVAIFLQTVEVAWQVGPIPVDDHFGKEVVLRWSKI